MASSVHPVVAVRAASSMIIILGLELRVRVRARVSRALVIYSGAQPDIAGGTASSHVGTVAGLAGIGKMLELV